MHVNKPDPDLGCNRTKRFVIRSELGSVKARLNSFIKLNETSPNSIFRLVS